MKEVAVVEKKELVNLEIKNMKPIGDHVLVKPIAEDDEMVHGALRLVVADTAKDKPNRGEVVAIGQGRILSDGQVREIIVKPGEKVLFSKYAGNEFSVNNEQYIILSYDDILVVLG